MNFAVEHVISNVLEKADRNFGTRVQEHSGLDETSPTFTELCGKLA